MLVRIYVLFFHISSKFQIFDYSRDPSAPLSASEGKIDLFSAGGNHESLDVPSGSGHYWIIGTFNSIDGLDGINPINTIVSQFNSNTMC